MRNQRITCLFLVLFLFGFSGCNDSHGPPPGDGRPIGPPMYPIAFCDHDRAIGTITQTGNNLAYYRSSGVDGTLGYVEYGFYWYPGMVISNFNDILLTIKDETLVKVPLKIIHDDGDIDIINEDIVSGMFAWSESGTRVFYVRNVVLGREIVREFLSENLEESFGVINSNNYTVRRDRLSAKGLESVVVSLEKPNPQQSIVAIYDRTGLKYQIAYHGISPQYSPNGNMVAFINGNPGADNATEVVLTNEQLEVLRTYSFSGFGTGATSLSWSYDNRKIALYVDVFTADPKLIYINLDIDEIDRIYLGDYTIAVDEDDMIWAAPEWNPEASIEMVLMVKKDNNYSIITATVNGTIQVVKTNMTAQALCRPAWKRPAD